MPKEKKITEPQQSAPVITAIYNGVIQCYKNIGQQEICFIPGNTYTLPADNTTVKSLLAQQLLSIQNN